MNSKPVMGNLWPTNQTTMNHKSQAKPSLDIRFANKSILLYI